MVPRGYKRLKVEQWAWLNAKAALIIWASLYVFITPPGPLKEIGWVLIAMGSFTTILGCILASVGLFISTDPIVHVRHRGLTIELSGLCLAICGPATYCLTQAFLAVDEPVRWTVAAFAWTLTSFIAARIVMIVRALRRGRY